MLIRSVKQDDLQGLVWSNDLEKFRNTIRNQIEASLTNENLFLVAEIDDEIVGQIEATFDKNPAYISALRVKEAYQNQGIGTSLVNMMEDKLRSKRIDKIKISVGIANEKARRLYERLGYTVTGKRTDRWEYTENGKYKTFEEDVWDLEKDFKQ